MNEELFYYGQDDQERYTATDLDDAIIEFIENYNYPEHDYPEFIEVIKLVADDISDNRFSVLERLLDDLDDEFINSDFFRLISRFSSSHSYFIDKL